MATTASKFHGLNGAVLTALVGLALFASRAPGAAGVDAGLEADGARLLRGAIDMHFHTDPHNQPGDYYDKGNIALVRLAQSRHMRALVLKHHHEPTGSLAYLVRAEVPGFDAFGGIVLNRTNGGINVDAVEFMATQIKGTLGRVVWLPAGDTEAEARASKNPSRSFVRVAEAGALLPAVNEVIAIIAKHDLILASGHIAPEDALLVFREARKQGVRHMIATHPMELAGKMTMAQMQEAAKLGAIVEVDFRNVLEDGRADAIRTLGPEHCLISELWTKADPPVQYAGLEGMGRFAAAMHGRGFTDRELDVMFKENPARLLNLSVR